MNILMINGTMRQESTYNIGKMLIDRIKKEEDMVIELFLPRDMPEFCRGCGMCIAKGEEKCPDYLIYMKRITRLIDDADLLVFTTPVFCFHASGQMKALLDHYGYRWMVHRPEGSMFKKQAVCISTAAGAGMKKALKDIKDSLVFWGVGRIFTYGIAVQNTSWEAVSEDIKVKIKEGLDKLASKIKLSPEEVQPSFKAKLMFYMGRMLQKRMQFNEADRVYWGEKGWLGKVRPWK